MKAAIIGCGRIADQHATHLKRMAECDLVAVCDAEPLMAEQFAERFDVPRTYDDAEFLLERERPDIVHITTPPFGHFELARNCLRSGSHVYVEKPFTVTAEEADALLELAVEQNRKITVGHHLQFNHEAQEMRRLVSDGALGGAPVHVESLQCYDLSDSYAQSFLRDPSHWLHRLPGGLLQNLISHGVARIAEFLTGDSPHVTAYSATSAGMKAYGSAGIPDELRAFIVDDNGTTANFTFSTQIRPRQNELRVYGPTNTIIVDYAHRTLVTSPARPYKIQLAYFLPPLALARQYRKNGFRNVRRFLKKDLHVDSGMNHLIRRFYDAVITDSPPPIPYPEIFRTARIMDSMRGGISALASRERATTEL